MHCASLNTLILVMSFFIKIVNMVPGFSCFLLQPNPVSLASFCSCTMAAAVCVVPLAAMGPSVSSAAPARMVEPATTSLESAPVRLAGR